MVAKLRRAAPDWNKASCLESATSLEDDLWFDNTDEGGESHQDIGKALCNGELDGVICPIREDCGLFALVNNERYGVWGGLSEQDRRMTRKVFRWDSKNPAEPHPEWRWRPTEELRKLLEEKIQKGELSHELAEEDEDDDA